MRRYDERRVMSFLYTLVSLSFLLIGQVVLVTLSWLLIGQLHKKSIVLSFDWPVMNLIQNMVTSLSPKHPYTTFNIVK